MTPTSSPSVGQGSVCDVRSTPSVDNKDRGDVLKVGAPEPFRLERSLVGNLEFRTVRPLVINSIKIKDWVVPNYSKILVTNKISICLYPDGEERFGLSRYFLKGFMSTESGVAKEMLVPPRSGFYHPYQ